MINQKGTVLNSPDPFTCTEEKRGLDFCAQHQLFPTVQETKDTTLNKGVPSWDVCLTGRKEEGQWYWGWKRIWEESPHGRCFMSLCTAVNVYCTLTGKGMSRVDRPERGILLQVAENPCAHGQRQGWVQGSWEAVKQEQKSTVFRTKENHMYASFNEKLRMKSWFFYD